MQPGRATESHPVPEASALTVSGMGISFGGLRALHDVHLVVRPGEIVGLIGPNGAGKTTLLDCVSGFLPAEGSCRLGATELTGLPPHRRAAAGLGRSFQDARLFDTLSVRETLSLAAAATADASTRVEHVTGLLGLGDYREKFVRELSTGTRRMVDLACLLLQRPRVVLLDEPSSGIAQRETEALGPLLLRVRDELRCAMLLIEHDMPLLLGVSDRLYALQTGRVIAQGVPADVIADPAVVRSYLGDDLAAINRSGVAGATTGA